MAFRAFVAVPVPDEPPLRALLDGLAATRGDVKPVDPLQLHFTLAFLGNVPDEAAGPLGEAVRRAAEGQQAFRAQLEGVGAFPNARRPRVIWAGTRDAEPLTALALRVRDEVARAGHPTDGKDFRAHVTLARVRSERNLSDVAAWLREHARDPLPEIRVDEVRLYQSTLGAAGPSYEALARARLEE